jgi:menaquinone-dependent protoporphyrinogen oxidase
MRAEPHPRSRPGAATRVLVAVASPHGSTREIAGAIAETLTGAGLEVDLRDVAEVKDLTPYDAVVLGSAVYMGHWVREARCFATDRAEELRRRRVWLFSSGPVGRTSGDGSDPVEVAPLLEETGAWEHRLFAGRLSSKDLGVCARLVAKLVRARDEDSRDWDAIAGWGREIAQALAGSPVRPA